MCPNLFQNATPRNASREISFSEFVSAVERSDVQEVLIQGPNVSGSFKSGGEFRTYAPEDPSLVPTLRSNGVGIKAMPRSDNELSFWGVLISWFPMLLLIGVWIFFMRQMQGGGGKALNCSSKLFLIALGLWLDSHRDNWVREGHRFKYYWIGSITEGFTGGGGKFSSILCLFKSR